MLNEKRITIKDVNWENIGTIVEMFKKSRVRDIKGFKILQLASSREDYGMLNSILSLDKDEIKKRYNLKRELVTDICQHTSMDQTVPFNILYKPSSQKENHHDEYLGTNRRQPCNTAYKRNGFWRGSTGP